MDPLSVINEDKGLLKQNNLLADSRYVTVRPSGDASADILQFHYSQSTRSLVDLSKSYIRVNGAWKSKKQAFTPGPTGGSGVHTSDTFEDENGNAILEQDRLLHGYAPAPISSQYSNITTTVSGQVISESSSGTSRMMQHYMRTLMEEPAEAAKGQYARNCYPITGYTQAGHFIGTGQTLQNTPTKGVINTQVLGVEDVSIGRNISDGGIISINEGYSSDGMVYTNELLVGGKNNIKLSQYYGRSVTIGDVNHNKGLNYQTYLAASGGRTYYHRPADGAWRNLVLTPGSNLEIEMSRSPIQFHSYGNSNAHSLFHIYFQVNSVELLLYQMVPKPEPLQDLKNGLISSPSLQQILRAVTTRRTVPASSSINLSNIYQGPRPAFVAFMICDSKAFSKNDTNSDYHRTIYQTVDHSTLSMSSESVEIKDGFVKSYKLSVGDSEYPSYDITAKSHNDPIFYNTGYLPLQQAFISRQTPYLSQASWLAGNRIIVTDTTESGVLPLEELMTENIADNVTIGCDITMGGSDFSGLVDPEGSEEHPAVANFELVVTSFVPAMVQQDSQANLKTIGF